MPKFQETPKAGTNIKVYLDNGRCKYGVTLSTTFEDKEEMVVLKPCEELKDMDCDYFFDEYKVIWYEE